MKFEQWKSEMLCISLQQAQQLAQMSALEDTKIEPEQLRKNIASILSILIETEEFLRQTRTSVQTLN